MCCYHCFIAKFYVDIAVLFLCSLFFSLDNYKSHVLITVALYKKKSRFLEGNLFFRITLTIRLCSSIHVSKSSSIAGVGNYWDFYWNCIETINQITENGYLYNTEYSHEQGMFLNSFYLIKFYNFLQLGLAHLC